MRSRPSSTPTALWAVLLSTGLACAQDATAPALPELGPPATWPLERIVADVNIDMIGRAGRQGDTFAMQVTPSHQHEHYSTLVQDGVALAPKFGVTLTSGDQYYARSDHYNFAKKGVPVVFFCDGEHPDYHQVTDHADKLDDVGMEAIARLAYWTTWLAAEAKGRPRELGKQDAW